MAWKEDLDFLEKVMIECQNKAKSIAEQTGCDQTAVGNSLFIESVMRIRQNKSKY